MIRIVRAPIRIDFAGGTTDIVAFANRFGGAVLNGAINRYVTGKLIATKEKTILSYYDNVPTSSGLGTSGAMNVVWLSLVTGLKDRVKIAETVFDLEKAMNVVGGKQDQYAACFGGVNLWEFKNNKVIRKEINLRKNFIHELENKLLLVYTGKPRYSSNVNKAMIENFKKNKVNVVNALKNIKEIAYEMYRVLKKEELDEFAMLMNEEWFNRKKLHKLVTNQRLESLIKLGLNNGARAAKVCGAAGGGSILFYSDNKNRLKQKLKREEVIDFNFDFEGLIVKEVG